MSARSAAHALIWLVCLLVATSVHAQGPTCSNGVPGVQSEAFEDICCAAGCLQCGGSRCISVNQPVGLGADDCCNNTIRNNGDDCATTGEGPCVIVTPVVENQCLDPTASFNRCRVSIFGATDLSVCRITDQDVGAGDFAECIDAAGPEDINALVMRTNDLTTLPSTVFDSLTNLETLLLSDNDLTTLPPTIFDSISNLESLELSSNALVTLPSGIFDSLTALDFLDLRQNPDLECLPTVPPSVTSLNVDTVGTECGCFLPDGSNPCGENVECSPGATGFTCG